MQNSNAAIQRRGRVRENFLPFHSPVIGENEISAVTDVLRSGWLTTGAKVREFERNFCRFIGCSHAVAVNSGTAALHLALAAVGLKPGDEVILPTMTFAATAEVVLYFGAKPILIDCEPDTLNMDPAGLAAALTSKTRAIIPVHFGGQSCDMERILQFAGEHDLRVIEDAAHALPASFQGRRIGNIGDITCFSFYATKTITTGEGGMATTENPEWADKMRMLSLHGISHDAWNRYSAEGSWYYEILCPGFKYNLTDLAASLGIEQLKQCDEFYERRRQIAAAYDNGFADLSEIKTPVCRPGVQHAWHLYVIQLEPERLRIDRRNFIEALREKNVGTSVHFIPLHCHPYYRNTFGYQPEDFVNASAVYERIVSLPIYPKMSDEDVEDVIESVRSIIEESRR